MQTKTPEEMKIANEQQMTMQKIAREKQNYKFKIHQKKMEETMFPAELLSADWRRHVTTAIMVTSPLSHQIPLSQYAKAVSCDPFGEISMMNFGILTNSIEAVSPEQLGLSRIEYVEFIEFLNTLLEKFNEILTDINKTIDKEVEVWLSNHIQNSGMKAIKGEA